MLIHRKLVLRMHDDDLIPKLFNSETFFVHCEWRGHNFAKDFRGVRLGTNLRLLPTTRSHQLSTHKGYRSSSFNFYNFGHFGWSSLIFPIIIITSHFLLPTSKIKIPLALLAAVFTFFFVPGMPSKHSFHYFRGCQKAKFMRASANYYFSSRNVECQVSYFQWII